MPLANRQLILIAHNVRSAHNVGSLFRTADGLGVKKLYLTGYSAHPSFEGDPRLHHEKLAIDRKINKTALGAAAALDWVYVEALEPVLSGLQKDGWRLTGLEQVPNSQMITEWLPPRQLALVVGNEVNGLEPAVLELLDQTLEIPMLGTKESFNVVQAAAMALYHARYFGS